MAGKATLRTLPSTNDRLEARMQAASVQRGSWLRSVLPPAKALFRVLDGGLDHSRPDFRIPGLGHLVIGLPHGVQHRQRLVHVPGPAGIDIVAGRAINAVGVLAERGTGKDASNALGE